MEKRRSVLIVEDEELIALDLELTLVHHGYDVAIVTHDESEAINFLRDGRPDAALLDLNLGNGTTSVNVARKLKAMDCPFMFVTGYSRRTFDLPEDLGDVPWISKPFKESQLVKELQRIV